MDKYIFIWFTCWLISLTTAQKIKQLRVPDIVNIRTHDSAILDCDYELNNTDGLVVKWFFGDDPKLVYQWIPNRAPQALGILKDRLDLHYKATNEEYSMYRAMNIKQLSLDLTGDYKCTVSSFLDEDTETKKMIVLEPPKKIEIFQVKAEDDSVIVVCNAQEIFPQPILNISYQGSPLLEEIETVTSKNDDGLYNVTTLLRLRDEAPEFPTVFLCTLNIPDTQYSQEVQLKYFPGPATTTEMYDDYDNETTVIPSTEENAAIVATSITWILLLSSVLLSFSFS